MRCLSPFFAFSYPAPSLPPSTVDDGLRRWKQAKHVPTIQETDRRQGRRISIGAKSQDVAIYEIRKNQRRETITLGKSISEDIWANKQGFREFYENDKFTDMTLEAHGKEFRVHRLILAFSSEYFAERLRSGELKENRMSLDAPDPDNVFADIVAYMYTGDIPITAEKAVPLLAMADYYAMTELKDVLSNFITKNVRRENAVTLLKKAMQFHADQICSRCIDVVASNFAYLYNVDYAFLPFDLMERLLYHKHLNVLQEFDLYIQVRSYVQSNAATLTNEMQSRVLESVRYRWLSVDQLLELMREELVPQRVLLAAAFARLEQYEGGGEKKTIDVSVDNGLLVPVHLQPRPLYPVAVRFRVMEKAIAPGIIDWIGRGAGRQDWQNPHASGDVVVSASSLCKGALADLLSTQENELWSNDVPASWFCLDFGPKRTIIASHYTLRHGGNYRADSLRNWDIQGSEDGWKWEVLHSHRHDNSLSGPFAIASWEFPENNSKRYRYFRCLQLGHNSSSRNFLVLSNIELYGKLFDSGSIDVSFPRSASLGE